MKARIDHIIENGEEKKWCGKCQKWLPLNSYSTNKTKRDGLQERCNSCRKIHWNKVGKFTRTKPPLEIRRQRSRHQLIKSYGITNEDFNLLLKKQNYKCAICKTSTWGRISPSIDHCHSTGKVRGLLCNRCNRVLGFLEDSVELLNNMKKYLQTNGKK